MPYLTLKTAQIRTVKRNTNRDRPMPSNKFKSAYLKIDRASEHIGELNELVRKERPFSYVLETNTQTGERATFAKKNEAVIDSIAVIAGDVVHNLHTALDHAYWEAVSPFATKEGERKNVQFPFSETANRFSVAAKNRLAHRVSQSFFDAIIGLKAYGEAGGNKLLYLINKIDTPEKHRTLTPIGNYTRISDEIIRHQVPDFPVMLIDCAFGQSHRDVGWRSQNIDTTDLGRICPPSTCIFEKELDVPVEVVFVIAEPDFRGPVIPTLNKLVDVVRGVLDVMKNAI